MKRPNTIDEVYECSSFRFLARGMKDKHALNIILSLLMTGLPNTFEALEQFCKEQLAEEDRRAD